MAALSLHYVTLRSRQIGLHLLPSLRGKKPSLYWDWFDLSCAFSKNWHAVFEMNCALMSWMHKRSANYLFTYLFRLEIKTG